MKRKAFGLTVLLASIGLFSVAGNAVVEAGGYAYENIAFFASANPGEYAAEGVAFYAPTTQVAGSVPVYRYYSSVIGDHFYTASESERNVVEQTPVWGYTAEGIAFYAFTEPSVGTIPVYRFYSAVSGDHFYTTSESEKASIESNPQWGYATEGIAFYVYGSQAEGSSAVYRFYGSLAGDHFYTASDSEKDTLSLVPVYRFYSNVNGDHFYTASDAEKGVLDNVSVSGYAYEGIAFYAYSRPVSGTVPVYRFYGSINRDHFYTASESEKSALESSPSLGYAYEGIAFYVHASQISGDSPVYRFYNGDIGDHFYTASESEKNVLTLSALGPKISVGIFVDTKSDLQDTPFKISANKDYRVKDMNGTVIATVTAGTDTRIAYDSSGKLKVYGSIADTVVKTAVSFDAADGYDGDLIMYVNRPGSSYDHYRGTMKIQYTDTNNIWAINTLPMEQYVWGMGETTGTGDMEHTKVMTDLFRTYGYWYVKYATKYNVYGFTIRGDSGSQVYNGYDWETQYPDIRTAAEATRGIIATYGGDVALTPYSSWSDGRTRSFEEVWGSKDYPWCQSVSDPYGKHPTMTTAQLQAAGNHMVGLIAHGSLDRAGAGWSHTKIMKYYYTGIELDAAY